MKTIYLAGPVILRTREEDPDGVAPIDHLGQPAKNRDGSPAKPFKIVEKHFGPGVHQVPDHIADHPYIQAHAKSAPRGAADDYTVEQLEAMLAEKRAKVLAGDKGGQKAGKQGAEGDPLPWPSDDEIRAMKPADLRGFLNANGGSDQGVKNADLVDAALTLKASQAQK